MNKHRFILEKYKGKNSRFPCPNCNQKETFSRYIDAETGEYLHPSVGRCNREINCGYHYAPKQFFKDRNISFHKPKTDLYSNIVKPKQTQISFIPARIFKDSLKAHETNHFVKYLIKLFGEVISSQLIGLYFIGTSHYWDGATVFWQIDKKGKVRTGKIMLYNPNTGARIKKPFNHIHWAHKALKLSEFELKQCFFGEHLLNDKTKTIAIVESEKTALIASVYFPQFIWLAVGSVTNLNSDKCLALKGRNVILFPDLKCYDKWKKKAIEFSHLANFKVSDLLERKASEQEKKQGLDLADYLIRFDFNEFIFPETELREHKDSIQPLVKVELYELIDPVHHAGKIEAEKFESWENDIKELETFFDEIVLPNQPVKINNCTTITDIPVFLQSHFAIIKTYSGKRVALPYLQRLKELKEYLAVNF